MSRQTWSETLMAMEQSGTQLSASTTPTSLLHSSGKFTLPPNFFSIGKAIRITFAGRISNLVTTPGTLTLDIRMGPTSNIVVYNGDAMQLSSTVHTDVPVMGDIMMTCRAIGGGTSANLLSQGRITSQALSLTAVADSTTTPATLLMPNTNPAVGTGFDSTVAMVVDMFGTFSVNNAANKVQVHQFWLESLN